MKNKKGVLIGLLLVALTLFSFKIYNDNREKGMDDLINYNIKDFEAVLINQDTISYKKEHAEQLVEFMSEYRVKKMKDSEWDSNVSKVKGFDVTFISKKGNPVIAHIYENRLIFLNGGDYYHIVNGPIDTAWVEEFTKEFEPVN